METKTAIKSKQVSVKLEKVEQKARKKAVKKALKKARKTVPREALKRLLSLPGEREIARLVEAVEAVAAVKCRCTVMGRSSSGRRESDRMSKFRGAGVGTR